MEDHKKRKYREMCACPVCLDVPEFGDDCPRCHGTRFIPADTVCPDCCGLGQQGELVRRICPKCKGEGHIHGIACTNCVEGTVLVTLACERCNGTGEKDPED